MTIALISESENSGTDNMADTVLSVMNRTTWSDSNIHCSAYPMFAVFFSLVSYIAYIQNNDRHRSSL